MSKTNQQVETAKPRGPEDWAQIIIDALFIRLDWDDKPTVTFRRYADNFYDYNEDTGIYRQLTKSDVEYLATNFLRNPKSYFPVGSLDQVYVEAMENIRRQTVADVIHHLQTYPGIYLSSELQPPCWTGGTKPTDGQVVVMSNGLLAIDDLIAGKDDVLHSWSPRWFTTVRLPYAFDPDAKCPKWLKFLDEIMESDPERIMLLQMWCGYLLTTDTSLQKFFMAVGEGANGKSAFFQVIEALLGSNNVSHVPLEIFGERFSLWPTIGKLANIVSECGEMDKIAEGYLKEFTSGDIMSIDRKFQTPINVKPSARMMIATNNLPRFSDKSNGLWRRLILVPFNHIVPEEKQNRQLVNELCEELGGILNWSILGLKLLRNTGFLKPRICQEAVDEFQTECDPCREFLTDCYELDPLWQVDCSKTYEKYRQWCNNNGYMAVSNGNFGKGVRRIFPSVKKVRKRDGDQRFFVYEGIRDEG